jgi:hypothetical protein
LHRDSSPAEEARKALYDRRRFVRADVVDNDDFERPIVLVSYAPKGTLEQPSPVVRGNNHRNERYVSHGWARL